MVVQEVGASDYTDGRVIVKTGLRHERVWKEDAEPNHMNPHAHCELFGQLAVMRLPHHHLGTAVGVVLKTRTPKQKFIH